MAVALDAGYEIVESIGTCGVVWLPEGRSLARQEGAQKERPDLPLQGLPPLIVKLWAPRAQWSSAASRTIVIFFMLG